MSGTGVAVAIFLLIAFIGGVVLGVIVIVSIASKREDRLYSLTRQAPDAMCRGARLLIGVGTRGGWPVEPVSGEDDDAQDRRCTGERRHDRHDRHRRLLPHRDRCGVVAVIAVSVLRTSVDARSASGSNAVMKTSRTALDGSAAA